MAYIRLAAVTVLILAGSLSAQNYMITDSTGKSYALPLRVDGFLRETLQPGQGEYMKYLDSALNASAISRNEFIALDDTRKTHVKYGRLLGLSLTQAAKSSRIPADAMKSWAREDSLFQYQMITMYQAQKMKESGALWTLVSAGALGGALYAIGIVQLASSCELVTDDYGRQSCSNVDASGAAFIGAGMIIGLAGTGLAAIKYISDKPEEIIGAREIRKRQKLMKYSRSTLRPPEMAFRLDTPGIRLSFRF